MKKIFTLVGLVALMAGFTACTKNQTELSGETLPHKITVSGFVRYLDRTDKELVDPGTLVNIYYGLPDEKGNVEFAVKTVAVDRDAFFEVQIGCPPGKALKVKAQSSWIGSYETLDEKNKTTDSDAHFFGESPLKDVACGSAVCFTIDMGPVSFDSEPGLQQ